MSQEAAKTDAAKNGAPSLKDDYVMKLEAQGKEWDAQVALMTAKADKAAANVKADFHKWQREFQDKRKDATEKLNGVRAAGTDAWTGVKDGAELAWAEVRKALDSASKKFG